MPKLRRATKTTPCPAGCGEDIQAGQLVLPYFAGRDYKRHGTSSPIAHRACVVSSQSVKVKA